MQEAKRVISTIGYFL